MESDFSASCSRWTPLLCNRFHGAICSAAARCGYVASAVREGASPEVLAIRESLLFGGVVELSLVGELDLATAPALEQRLSQLRSERKAVRVDLSRVEFIDSSGLRVLLGAWKSGREMGWNFEIGPDVPPQAEHLFKITGTELIVDQDGAGR